MLAQAIPAVVDLDLSWSLRPVSHFGNCMLDHRILAALVDLRVEFAIHAGYVFSESRMVYSTD